MRPSRRRPVTRHGLLTLDATTDPDGRPLVDGRPWDSAHALARVRERAGDDARLVADSSASRFDVLSLLVATDGALRAFGHDARRLRPNIVLSGLPGNQEHDLAGRALQVGDVLIGVHSVRQRCVVTTIDPDTGAQDLDVFRHIRTAFGERLALNCWVIRPGRLDVGAAVQVVDSTEHPVAVGGWIVGAPYPHTSSERASMTSENGRLLS